MIKSGKVNVKDISKSIKGKANFHEFLRTSNATKVAKTWTPMTPEDVKKLSTTPLNFEPGSIFKRVSMHQETVIRPDGFFASFKDEDVERYKAVLPIYWKQWAPNIGGNPNHGFVNSYRANAEIKAPSVRKTFDIFQSMLDDPIPGVGTVRKYLDLFDNQASYTPERFARANFVRFSQSWNNEMSPIPRLFFDKVKAEGFNAIVDINDLGSIGDTPMRILDGTIFSVEGHEELTRTGIKAAQAAIIAIKHMIQSLTNLFS